MGMPRALQRALRQSFGNLKEMRVMSVGRCGKGMWVVDGGWYLAICLPLFTIIVYQTPMV